MYYALGREYLFGLSKDQELDGSRVRNKALLINKSSLTKNVNVLIRLLLCNGVSRILLCAVSDIVAGEELFYDYSHQKEKRANFKGEARSGKETKAVDIDIYKSFSSIRAIRARATL